MNRFWSILFFCLLGFGALYAAEEEAEQTWDVTLLVNPHDPKATDTGVGELAKPFRSIQAAADLALEKAANGQTVRVLIQPGVYREAVSLIGEAGTTYAEIKFEGSIPGEVFLRGSDPIDGWDVNDDNYFERSWDPSAYTANPMVFVEIARLEEVSSKRELRSGRVFFERKAKKPKIYFLPPVGALVKKGTVTIGRSESAAFTVRNVTSLFLESLIIEKGYLSGIDAFGGEALIVNNCIVEYCQRDGIQVQDTAALRLRRAMVDRCGGHGIELNKIGQVVITGTEANLNGWKVGKSTARAVSLTGCGPTQIWSLRVVENHGAGLVIGGGLGEVSITRLTSIKNAEGGGAVVFTSGDTAIKGSEVAYNGDIGFWTNSAVRLNGNILYGNVGKDLNLTEGANLTLERCIVVSQRGYPLIDLSPGAQYTGTQNLFYTKTNAKPFQYQGEAVDFARWQELTRTDLGSYFGEPDLINPAKFDFLPQPSSPWFDMNNWPVRELN